MGQTIVNKDGQRVVLPFDEATAEQLKGYLSVPADRHLVQREDGGTRFLNNQDVVQLRNGMNFGDAPRFQYGSGAPAAWLATRLAQEAAAVQVAYRVPASSGYDPIVARWWVFIDAFPLPQGWSHIYTPLLVTVLDNYPQAAPDGFYLSNHLRDRHGRTPGHYFETGSARNPFSDRGWAWFCIHPTGWRPGIDILEGDNIFRYLTLIHAVMSESGGA